MFLPRWGRNLPPQTILVRRAPRNFSNMSAATAISRDALVDECAATLVQSFADYNAHFRAVTRRAPQKFENRDWRGSLRDAVERIELYDKCVNRAVAQMQKRLGEDVTERALWA